MEDLPNTEKYMHARRTMAEAVVRDDVRRAVGEALTDMALDLAMRGHTPDSYRRSVLRDNASPIALACASLS